MAGVGTVLRDSLMAFSVAFQAYPDTYQPLRNFAATELDRRETANMLPAGSNAKYRELVAMSLEDQRTLLASDEGKNVIKTLLDILDKVNDSPMLSAQILTLLDGATTDDNANLGHLVRAHKHPKAPVNLVVVLNRHLIPPVEGPEGMVIAAAASHLLAAFLAETAVRPGSEDPIEQISELVSFLIQQSDTRLIDVVVYSLMPLFKIEAARRYFLAQDGVSRVLVKCLQTRKGASQPVYGCLFCLWMLSFMKECLPMFLRQEYELIPLIVSEIRRTDKEKVLRVALSTLKNLSESEDALELMVDNRLINEIDLIARRVIKDPDVVELVRDMGDLLQKSMKILSTYEKYLKELNRGELVPGITHSEKFWKENFRQFESNKFENVQKLVAFLADEMVESKPQTAILALGDLGEFARFHPYGKSVLEKLGAKERAMSLLNNPKRGIKEAALLCTQKIMIHQWQRINF